MAEKYYGSYPDDYLRSIASLFPDKQAVLHLFSGKAGLKQHTGATLDIKSAARSGDQQPTTMTTPTNCDRRHTVGVCSLSLVKAC
jgi:hypothetical protein